MSVPSGDLTIFVKQELYDRAQRLRAKFQSIKQIINNTFSRTSAASKSIAAICHFLAEQTEAVTTGDEFVTPNKVFSELNNLLMSIQQDLIKLDSQLNNNPELVAELKSFVVETGQERADVIQLFNLYNNVFLSEAEKCIDDSEHAQKYKINNQDFSMMGYTDLQAIYDTYAKHIVVITPLFHLKQNQFLSNDKANFAKTLAEYTDSISQDNSLANTIQIDHQKAIKDNNNSNLITRIKNNLKRLADSRQQRDLTGLGVTLDALRARGENITELESQYNTLRTEVILLHEHERELEDIYSKREIPAYNPLLLNPKTVAIFQITDLAGTNTAFEGSELTANNLALKQNESVEQYELNNFVATAEAIYNVPTSLHPHSIEGIIPDASQEISARLNEEQFRHDLAWIKYSIFSMINVSLPVTKTSYPLCFNSTDQLLAVAALQIMQILNLPCELTKPIGAKAQSYADYLAKQFAEDLELKAFKEKFYPSSCI